MTEENIPESEAGGLSPASRKTKEQWLEEGRVLMFHPPIRYEEALAAFEQATSLDETSAEASNGMGDSLFALQRYEEALAAYAHVIRLDSDPFYTWMAHVNRGTLLASCCRYEEALTAYEEASRLEPNNASIWRHIGDVLISLERPDEAKQAYARAGQPGSREEA